MKGVVVKLKARLVVKGFTEDLPRHEKESPVVTREVIKVFLSIAANSCWSPKSIDIKTAFLQGKPLQREIFVKPPIPEPGVLWKLKKPVYGLQDAPRQWYLRVKDELVKSGLQVFSFEPALFVLKKNELCLGVICLHVDDFLYAGTNEFEESVIKSVVCKEFIVGCMETCPLLFTGLKISHQDGEVFMSQEHFIETLEVLKTGGEKDITLDVENTRKMKGLLGKLQWVASQTRPDVAFGANTMSGKSNIWTCSDALDVNKLVRRLEFQKSAKLRFSQLESPEYL